MNEMNFFVGMEVRTPGLSIIDKLLQHDSYKQFF
jgi:hypothetical protein